MFGSKLAVLTMATGSDSLNAVQVQASTGTVILAGTNATTGEAVQQMADLDYFTCLLLLLCPWVSKKAPTIFTKPKTDKDLRRSRHQAPTRRPSITSRRLL